MLRKINIWLKHESSGSLFKAAFWIGVGFEMGSQIVWSLGDLLKNIMGVALG